MTYKLSEPGWFESVNGIKVVHRPLPAEFMLHAGSFVAHNGIELHRQIGDGDDITSTQLAREYPIATWNISNEGHINQYNHMTAYAPWHGDSVSEYAYGIEHAGFTGKPMTATQLKSSHALVAAIIEFTEDRFGEVIPVEWVNEVNLVNFKVVKGVWNHKGVARGPLNENGHTNIMEGETRPQYLNAVRALLKPAKPLPAFPGLMKKGDDGRGVILWKRRMGSKGLFMMHSSNDGPHFGSALEGATKEFQRRRKLTQDGVVGPKTWAAGWGG